MSAQATLQSVKWINYINSWQEDNAIRLQLVAVLEELVDAYEQLKDSSDIGSQALIGVITEFALFSIDFFFYFMKSEKEDTEEKAVVRKLHLRQELRQVITKIERELMTLRVPIEQRAKLQEKDTVRERRLRWLQISDAIATDVLKRATDTNPDVERRYCLTIFDESNYARVNRWSYRPLPTVAIPSTKMEEPWMWLGIVHEIAHYFYNTFEIPEDVGYSWEPGKWSSSNKGELSKRIFLKDRLQSQLFDNEDIRQAVLSLPHIRKMPLNADAHVEPTRIWHSWLEEIFADVFGIFLLGPAYAHSLILILLANNDKVDLFFNDDDHPISFLRPLMQVEALQELASYHGLCKHTFLQTESSLLGQDEFDLPSPEEIWQAATGLVAGRRGGTLGDMKLKSYADALRQPFGQLTVNEYVTMSKSVVQIITKELCALADRGILQLYTKDDHENLRNVAKRLADGDTAEPNTETMTPSLMLAAAWYAWREITQPWVNYKEILPAERKLLALPCVRSQRLEAIREWLLAHTNMQMDDTSRWYDNTKKLGELGQIIRTNANFLEKDEMQVNHFEELRYSQSVFEYLSPSFDRLIGMLVEADYKPEEIREFLLKIEFSTEEFHIPKWCKPCTPTYLL